MTISTAAGQQAHNDLLARIRKLPAFNNAAEKPAVTEEEDLKTVFEMEWFRANVLITTCWNFGELAYCVSAMTDFGAFHCGAYTDSQDHLIFNLGQAIEFLASLKQNIRNDDE